MREPRLTESGVRVIGVIDARGGRAVHARGGVRAAYAPVEAAAGVAVRNGDALSLARVYLDVLGLRELYVADLDAIMGGARQRALIARVAALGAPVWLDAGVGSDNAARDAAETGARHVVVGLETLASLDIIGDVCAAVGGERVAFSLDLRDGAPLTRARTATRDARPASLAAQAVAHGASGVIVLDLARVGSGAGLDVRLIREVRAAVPHTTLLAGGGVRDAGDLTRLAAAGCDGALVASALHDGRLTAADLAADPDRQAAGGDDEDV